MLRALDCTWELIDVCAFTQPTQPLKYPSKIQHKVPYLMTICLLITQILKIAIAVVLLEYSSILKESFHALLSCIKKKILKGPSCKLFTSEEDGFNGGRAIIELGDVGNIELEKVFGSRVGLYGLAISGCPTLTPECLPLWYQNEIVCLLPRSMCSG